MSVVKSKRGQSELEVITQSRNLASYTIKICSNEKNFPKRYRWCITNNIVNDALNIYSCIQRSNAIFVKFKVDYDV